MKIIRFNKFSKNRNKKITELHIWLQKKNVVEKSKLFLLLYAKKKILFFYNKKFKSTKNFF